MVRITRLRMAMAAAGIVPLPPDIGWVYGASADTGQVNDTDPTTGSRYYFDASSGDDTTGTGTSGAPWKTAYMVRQKTWIGYWDAQAPNNKTIPTFHPIWAAAEADSAILLKRGTTFTGSVQATAYTLGGQVGDYLFGAYGVGARPLIVYTQSDETPNASNNVVRFWLPGARVSNLDLDANQVATPLCTVGTGTFAAGDIISSSISGASGVFQRLMAGGYYAISLTTPNTFVVDDVISADGGTKTATVTGMNSAAVIGITVVATDCEISNVSVTKALAHGILIGGAATPADNLVIRNVVVQDCCHYITNGAGIDGGYADNLLITQCTSYNNGVVGGLRSHNMYINDVTNSVISRNWCYMTANWGNHALVMHGVCDTVLIEENLWEYCQNGLGINDGYAGIFEVFNLFTIRRNVNRFHGKRAGQSQGQAVELSCMTNSILYNNLHYETTAAYSLTASRSVGGVDASSANVTVVHETIHNVKGGLRFTGAMTGLVAQNNILSSTSTGASGDVLLNADAAAVAAGLIVRNCVLWAPNNTIGAVTWNGTTYSIDGWLSWMDTYRPGHGNIKADPLFVDAAAGDFRVQSGSPCKGAGYAAGITDDFVLNSRSMTTPTIGAYE